MPVYTYLCPCGLAIDKLMTIKEMENTKVFCKCKKEMKKVPAAPALLGMDNLGRSQKNI